MKDRETKIQVQEVDVPAIEIKDVVKVYKLYDRARDRVKESLGLGRKQAHKLHYALNGVSMNIYRGETVGIIGTNGSGKSTILKIITGVLNPTAGEAHVAGRISALLELGAGFNMEYNGIENVYLNGTMIGFSEKEISDKMDDILSFADIGEYVYQPVKTYSSGMFVRLAFAVAINVEPDILIVDEALSVGDLFFQNKCFRKFEELRNNGITILFVSHDISSVRQMCSRVLWIEKGVQKIFDHSDLVCDMYMDMKRKDMNQENIGVRHKSSQYLDGMPIGHQHVTFPKVQWKTSSIESEKIRIESLFLVDSDQQVVNYMEVDHDYAFHVVVRLLEDMDELIVGVVVENNKGIPLYDLNNYINTGKVIRGEKGQLIEVIFSFRLPRIMKGIYLVAAAAAQGTQKEHVMLTWLHGAAQIEVVNPGYNSSYIEIPARVRHNIYDPDSVEII